MKECKECKIAFIPERNNQQYCSIDCRRTNKNNKRKKQPADVKCLICDVTYTTKRKDRVTCSATCSQRLWVKNNPEKNKVRQKNRIPPNERNPVSFKIIQRRYKNKKRKVDPLYKLHETTANLIRGSLYAIDRKKNGRTTQILGCTISNFKKYIESKFEPWMTWDNYGLYNGELNYGWDIDHIEPLFPKDVVRTEDDIVKLNHYTNLQPLCSKINRVIKRNNL